MAKRPQRSLQDRRTIRRRGPQARGIVTRQRLLDAARELFAAEGYAGVSRAAVAKRAGYGMGTIYHHFPNKRDLLLELIDEWAATMPVQRRAAFDVGTALAGSPRRAARDFLRKSYQQLRGGRPSFYRVIVTEAARDPEVRRRYETAHRGITAWMAELARVGQQTGMVRPQCNPEAAAFLLHHVIESTLTEISSQKVEPRFRDLVLDELAEMISWYLLGEPRGRAAKP